ncbi:hypothetical protein CCR75_007456 [Bremia lactucae]|uniref:HP domain-containing protein n=1 Tax=Bremia lactucae TaxID=4779 RepID=A0A976IBI8_BRELC|nr:hypothetical protein CCR75_007456 [Bremia lactucae]
MVTFTEAGKKAGLEAWRIENFMLVAVSATDLHKLHSGDSYIFLKTSDAKTYDLFIYKLPHNVYLTRSALPLATSMFNSGLTWNAHFWLGKNTSADESGVAAYKTVELDDALGGVPVQHRECQGHESALFLSYFKETGLQYLDGGVSSGFHEVKRDDFVTRLYRIKGKRTVRVEQVPLQSSSLSVDDAFVLDAGLELYLYADKQVNRLEKAKALDFIAKIKEARGGRVIVTFIDEEPENSAFWKLLGGMQTVMCSSETDEQHESIVKKNTTVLRVNGSTSANLRVQDVTPSSGVLTKDILNTEDVFLLDVGDEVFVWVGKMASASERANALLAAVQYLKQENRSSQTPMTRVVEEGETPFFTALFKAWTEPKKLEFGYQSSKGVATMQSDSNVDVVALAKAASLAEEEIGLDPNGDGKHDLTVWRVEELERVQVPKEQYGQFFDGDSYILLHEVTLLSGKVMQVIYFWQGRLSSTDEKAASALLATFLDDRLHGVPIQVRVTQGKEPAHFRALFHGTMIVHAGGKASAFANRNDEDSYDNDGVSLFQVKGTNEKNTVATQVEEQTTSLTSGDSYVLVTPNKVYEWHGVGSSSAECEIASKVAARLRKDRDIEVVKEGCESDEFWKFLGGKGEYAKTKSSFEAPHEPRLFQCSNAYGYFDACEIVNFGQDDLNVDDVFLLDTYTTLYVWIGSGANESERREAMTLAQKYLTLVKSDGRDAGTPIMAVHCNSEPLLFTSHFLAWNSNLFTKNEFLDPYETRLQKLKEEKEKNALKDLAGTITNEGFIKDQAVALPKAADASSIAAPRVIPFLPTDAPVTNTPYESQVIPVVSASESETKATTPALVPLKIIPAPASKSGTATTAPAIAKATGSAGETFTYEQLTNGVEGIDITRKETYLSDAEFHTVMSVSKEEFQQLPKWKQQAKKREVDLF